LQRSLQVGFIIVPWRRLILLLLLLLLLLSILHLYIMPVLSLPSTCCVGMVVPIAGGPILLLLLF
jgi:hypothetical protein